MTATPITFLQGERGLPYCCVIQTVGKVQPGTRNDKTTVRCKAQVMAIAKAIKALPEAPRRSILVALVGAEEQGLLGSQYYAANPTFPPGTIAANLNYDGSHVWGHPHDETFVRQWN